MEFVQHQTIANANPASVDPLVISVSVYCVFIRYGTANRAWFYIYTYILAFYRPTTLYSQKAQKLFVFFCVVLTNILCDNLKYPLGESDFITFNSSLYSKSCCVALSFYILVQITDLVLGTTKRNTLEQDYIILASRNNLVMSTFKRHKKFVFTVDKS